MALSGEAKVKPFQHFVFNRLIPEEHGEEEVFATPSVGLLHIIGDCLPHRCVGVNPGEDLLRLFPQQTQVNLLLLQQSPYSYLLEEEAFGLGCDAAVDILRLNKTLYPQVVGVDLAYKQTIILFNLGDETVELDLDEEAQLFPVAVQFSKPVQTQAYVVEAVVDELTVEQHGIEVVREAFKMGFEAALQVKLQERRHVLVIKASIAIQFCLTVVERGVVGVAIGVETALTCMQDDCANHYGFCLNAIMRLLQ